MRDIFLQIEKKKLRCKKRKKLSEKEIRLKHQINRLIPQQKYNQKYPPKIKPIKMHKICTKYTMQQNTKKLKEKLNKH